MSSETLAVKALRSAADKYETGEVVWFGNGQPARYPFGEANHQERRCAAMTIGSESYTVVSGDEYDAIMAVAEVAYKALAATLPPPDRNPFPNSVAQNTIINWNDRLVEGGVQEVIFKLRLAATLLEAQQS